MLALVLAAAAIALIPSGGALAQGEPDQPYADWNRVYPGFPSDVERSSRIDCARGSDACIDRTLGEMWRRFHRVIPFCNHNNLFSLTYLRVTEEIHEAMGEGFYPDMHWINHQDAIFARIYFLAYDNWLAGKRELVPEAWRIAFDAGRDRSVEGIGNLLLSMNGHINRDFPFILYHAGLVNPDGSSKKPEHDAGNELLRQMYGPVLEELAHRFDPSIASYNLPGVADDEALFQVLVGWREGAWQNAQRLADAESDAERRQVAASIEEYATSQAELIFANTAYGPGEDSTARDARCAEFGGQRAGYRRGADVAKPKHGFRLEGPRLAVPVKCPRGPGPCVGRVHVAVAGPGEPAIQRFEAEPGRRRRIAIALGDGQAVALEEIARSEGRLRIMVRSRLEPGVDAVRRLRAKPAGA